MNLLELKRLVDYTIESAVEEGYSPGEVLVSLQIDGLEDKIEGMKDPVSACSSDVELHFDGDLNVSGCVLLGTTAEIA